VPLDLLFSSYQRLVRDLGRQLGKQVRLETSGTDTELEKNIIEELKDPLLHLIRNAMDHGIENPDERQAAGKDPTGTLSLGARYEGASVVIAVEDDGAGLNTDAILRKAIERQLVSPDSKLSPDEINQLIFLPGFSTASSVSNVSGRGVGMDVVKRSIEGLRGSISVQTRVGQGTSIRLRIPLSLSVVEALLVQVGGELYAINLTSIVACRAADSLKRMAGGNLVIFDEQPVPRIDLSDFFNPGHSGKPDGVVIFLSNGERTVGLLVDEVLNSIQAVIKTLGKAFTDARGLNGAVVLGDGSLALVIDSEYFQSTHGKQAGTV
jgi:two-component system chemotaxis sensor kinase CheA